jgi:tellurite resistance protein TerC
MSLFPFAEYWWFYLAFSAFILVIVFLDLGIFHKQAHEVSFKESSAWTVLWISLALLFNWLFYQFSLWKFAQDPRLLAQPGFNPEAAAKQSALEFLTGFVVEKSLAIDNIFIFAVVFSYFAIPKMYQHRILLWGIIGALIFRGLFIAMGSYLMQYHAVVIFFGGLLILTGAKMFFAGTETQSLENNFIVRTLQKIFRIHPHIHGQSFFLNKEGLTYVTPLFLSLTFIEMTDILFAVDSVPAIFALTNEPLIVFTSNIFAILGLRSMYFMLAGSMDRFAYIKYGLAAVLVFVGAKMVFLNNHFGGKFPISWSLLIIFILIGTPVAYSVLVDHRNKRRSPLP